ncbi:MAG: system FeS assembly protein, NifU family [Oscillospiraceae bacterium]|nr:system FeS assembly protein, NifU family [Oscillospiraceae bacterium]
MELNELYSDIVTEYAADKSHWHPLAGADVHMRGVNPSCGDELNLELDIEDGRIRQAGLTGGGCAISEASASIMADMVEGKTLEEAKTLAGLFLAMVRKEITDVGQLETLEDAQVFENISNMPARTKCAVLAWHTLDEALKKWEAEQL